ncbi:phage baseplate assembly protein V [Streptomyces sp. NPDC051840]|uniref:phage baseplate assembly protein V n=1 Tax=Streptomyces sp. NPDC051840 TaxID=3154752 RepID=UPI003415EC82
MTPLHGTYSAIVVSAQDPQNRGRARLRIPQLMGTAVSGWAEPVTLGATLPGDTVFVAFDGGDRNRPIYWPSVGAGRRGWEPLTLGAGWAGDTGTEGPPMGRLTQDGMIELHGAFRAADNAVPAGNVTQTVGTLAGGLKPVYRAFALAAGPTSASQGAQPATVWGPGTGTTTSATFVDTLSTGGLLTLNFVAPISGKVSVLFGANCTNSSETGVAYMSFTLLRGSTELLAPSLSYATYRQYLGFSSTMTSYPVEGLTPGSTHTITAAYRSNATGNTASFDKRFLRVDPVGVNPDMAPRIGVYQDGTVRVVYPHGTSNSYVSLAGIRVRAQ